MGPMLAPWSLLSGSATRKFPCCRRVRLLTGIWIYVWQSSWVTAYTAVHNFLPVSRSQFTHSLAGGTHVWLWLFSVVFKQISVTDFKRISGEIVGDVGVGKATGPQRRQINFDQDVLWNDRAWWEDGLSLTLWGRDKTAAIFQTAF